MTETFAWETNTDEGYLFALRPVAYAAPEVEEKRRAGESAVDYRIRRQFRDVAATAPLFPAVRARR
jgi:hypothetical protein